MGGRSGGSISARGRRTGTRRCLRHGRCRPFGKQVHAPRTCYRLGPEQGDVGGCLDASKRGSANRLDRGQCARSGLVAGSRRVAQRQCRSHSIGANAPHALLVPIPKPERASRDRPTDETVDDPVLTEIHERRQHQHREHEYECLQPLRLAPRELGLAFTIIYIAPCAGSTCARGLKGI